MFPLLISRSWRRHLGLRMDPIAPLIMPTAVGDRANAVDSLRGATCARLIALVAFAALLLAPSAGPVVGPHGSKTIVIGHSVRGQPIRAYERGDRSVPPTVVVGVIHGSEPAGLKVVARLRSMPLPAGVHLWLVPTVNPDGLAAGTRQNADGVDLNRNWPAGWVPNGRPWDGYYSGPRPLSEPENRAMRAFLLRVRPALTIWYHQPLDLVYGSDPHVALVKRYARLTGLPYRRLSAPPGAATRWERRRFPSSPAFVVEFPAGPLPTATARRHAAAVSALAQGLS
jgi:murein peptide amidase A